MAFSEVTAADVAKYLRLDDASDDLLGTILEAARGYVLSYTGQTADALDAYPDIVIALMVLCQDMYDNRAYQLTDTKYTEGNINRVVDTILGMYRVNLL